MSRVEKTLPGSETVHHIRSFGPKLTSALGISEFALDVVDALVAISEILARSEGTPGWADELATLLEGKFQHLDPDLVATRIETLLDIDGQGLARRVEKLRAQNWQAFARRLLGEGRWHLLQQSLARDSKVVAGAIRRGTEYLEPYAVATQDALSVLTEEQVLQVSPNADYGNAFVKSVIVIGQALDRFLETDVSALFEGAGRYVAPSLDIEELETFASRWRPTIARDARERLEQFNSTLVRKINGARDALDHSEDGVSQAANSLVELIDRLLRDYAGEGDVLAWVDAHYADRHNFSHLDSNGNRHPVKQAQVLFMISGGSAPAVEGREFMELLALSITASRRQLQKLKHADSSVPEELEQLKRIIGAIEGALTVVLWLSSSARNPQTV